MSKVKQTPTQTIGPFFAYGLTAIQYGYHFSSFTNGDLLGDSTANQVIWINGKVYDGEGKTVHDAMIELLQADANGIYLKNANLKGFKGFGRLGTGTEADHSFTFKTIKPGSVKGQAPHINIILFMRGSLHTLYSRLYFSDEATLNKTDPILSEIPESRKNTLIAERTEIDGKIIFNFDIRMQGDKETVFFKV